MAQATRSSSTRGKRTSSTGSRSTNRNGRSGASRSSTSRSSKTTRSRNSTRSRNGASTASKSKVAELAAKAKPQAEKVPDTVRKTGEKVSGVASKAKGPLLAGGAALAGLAGGLALKSRTENRRPIGKLKTRALPKSLKNIDLGKVDLEAITDAGRRIRSIGEQVGDVADAAEKTRKKHK
jgi:hypothetical protein